MGDGNGGGVDNGSGVDYGSGVDDGGSVNDGGSVDRIVGRGVVRRSIVADDALGGYRAVVQRQETSAGGSQHGAEGEHLDTKPHLEIPL